MCGARRVALRGVQSDKHPSDAVRQVREGGGPLHRVRAAAGADRRDAAPEACSQTHAVQQNERGGVGG